MPMMRKLMSNITKKTHIEILLSEFSQLCGSVQVLHRKENNHAQTYLQPYYRNVYLKH